MQNTLQVVPLRDDEAEVCDHQLLFLCCLRVTPESINSQHFQPAWCMG